MTDQISAVSEQNDSGAEQPLDVVRERLVSINSLTQLQVDAVLARLRARSGTR